MLHATGSLLTIDVGDRSVTTTDIDDELAAFIGGRGVATKLAHDRIPFDADPLGADNRLYFASGPLQQSNMSFTGRMSLTGLSPLTDGLLSSNAGGYLSRNFVATGHSVVEIVGESDELLAIHVTDEGVEFEPVPELEDAGVPAVTDAMNDRHGLESEHLVTIGPAGERVVRFASVMTYDERAFGRGGLGAVMGAKSVKCISFDGDSAPALELPNEDLHMEVHREAATSDDIMRRQGTTNLTEFLNDEFSLPTRYYSELEFEGAADIGGNAVEEKKYEKAACSVCAFACKLPTRDEETGLETEGPEFETVFSFGSNCGVDDVVDVMKSNELCDRYGMDTISCGVTVAAYLAANDEFGNAELVHDLVEQIAFREGDGDLLAEGVARIHDELGVENWAIKGLEHAAHDGRVVQGQGLSYAVANRGGDHMYSTTMIPEYHGKIDPEGTAGKAEHVIRNENLNALRDSGIICQFGVGRAVEDDRFERLFDADFQDLLSVGSRVVELERHFNNQRGFDGEDDWVPYDLPDLESSLQEYYDERGWNDDGTVPADRVDAIAGSD
ncbi:aldehyde ferredoxin oxidoreductase C-terminal domain-containing protein [Natrarchaeobius oligotrophus]|uniref:Aldehyde ferredoxin oxidoreductase n=1 Tax=Natrarchaeobius chitinivorans TaxID=1679083 RepID=A0A3N6N4D8_NATCH|nr:aldehyde ferredoxin oxidoreductase C-terminal domain-containing protein [Natrarchaeobius chitinivorans]RQH02617.1 aldehyde ferredoxin oxidoreductase [Natrarchaeobius chitinivorans]